jgi:hypothetical protein
MKIVDVTLQDDASAWTAVVEVRGVRYRASYVASKLSVGLVPYKHPPRRPRWVEQHVRTWAEQKIAAISEAWMVMHRALYEPDNPSTTQGT